MLSYMIDKKLSSVLHLLLHMAESDRPLTSEELARFLDTHAVVVRRTLAGLRALGYVSADKGHGGGWTLARDLHTLTLRDIYEAVGAPPLFAIGHRGGEPACLVEQAVNASLDETLAAAHALIDQRLAGITLADLAADFERRLAAHPRRKHRHAH